MIARFGTLFGPEFVLLVGGVHPHIRVHARGQSVIACNLNGRSTAKELSKKRIMLMSYQQ